MDASIGDEKERADMRAMIQLRVRQPSGVAMCALYIAAQEVSGWLCLLMYACVCMCVCVVVRGCAGVFLCAR